MGSFWGYAEKVATILAFAAVGGGTFFAYSLDQRLNVLETQAQTIATAPSIERPGDGGPILNPIMQACADLAIRAAQAAIEGKTIVGVPDIKELMTDLGCDRFAPPE